MAYPTRQGRKSSAKGPDSGSVTLKAVKAPSMVEPGPETNDYPHSRRAQKTVVRTVCASDQRTKAVLRLRQPESDAQRGEVKTKEQIQQDWLKRLRPRLPRNSAPQVSK
ncbi:hypothetical protein BBP40_002144 [Aspergillus hancockii]|nr:hypothetical protein BBP40_002144 [Aspergillus hancockii]